MIKTWSALLVGVDLQLIQIETVIGSGFSGLNILGLPSEQARDMRERVRSALETIGILTPARRVVVNITPAERLKLSRTPLAQLDFAIAAGIILAFFQEKTHPSSQYQRAFFAGELSLSGEIKPLSYQLPFELLASQLEEKDILYLPPFLQSPFLLQSQVRSVSSLQEWIENSPDKKERTVSQEDALYKSTLFEKKEDICKTIALLLKNTKLTVALLVAALGRHPLLVLGEPGVGKSFSLKKIKNLLPPLSIQEHLEVKLINESATTPPFRMPHHSASLAALIGGASLKPGEVTLAHRGVLFLDEIAEFSRDALESLREPLDSGFVAIAKANGSLNYPAQFLLCATANPCPCGFFFSLKRACRCPPTAIKKYLQKLSGPLLDRFALQVWVTAEQNKAEDIFSRRLKKYADEKKLMEFTEHFLHAQEREREKNLAQGREHSENTENHLDIQKEIKNSFLALEEFTALSLRGQKQILEMAQSFVSLFPDCVQDPFFAKHILQYRELGSILQRSVKANFI